MLFSKNKFLKEINYWLIAIIFLALVMRLIITIKYGDFWFDEMFSFTYSQKPWLESFKFWLWETNPPLHLIILKFWFYIFPAKEFFARLPSVIAGAASVYAIYLLAKEVFNKKIALLSSLYLALHTYNIFWSATARVYSILMLLSILSTLYFYKIFIKKTEIRQWNDKLFAVINFLLIFSHLSALFLLAGQFVTLIIFTNKKDVWYWIKVNLIPLVAGVIWIGLSIYTKSNNELNNSWFINLDHGIFDALKPLSYITVGIYPTIKGIAILLIVITIILVSLYKDKKQNKNELGILTLLGTLPILIPYSMGLWHIKFFIEVIPIFSIIIPYSLLLIFEYQLVVIGTTIAIELFSYYYLLQILPLNDWKNTINVIKINSQYKNSAVIYNSFVLKPEIDFYQLPQKLNRPIVPLNLYKNMSWDDIIIRKNYIRKKITEQEKDLWLKTNNLEKKDNITLLQDDENYMNELNNLLSRHNYKLIKGPIKVPIINNKNLYFYEKNKTSSIQPY